MELSISEVKFSELNLANRIDAEHYQPHFLDIISAVKNKQYKKLSELVSKNITTGHTPSMKEESFYGGDVKFIKTDNLRDNKIVENFSHFLSDKGADKLKNASLKSGDIIVTIIGATFEVVGRVARIFPDLGKASINQNISLIRPTIPSGYLTCFLMSKYGKQQLYYLSRQTEQVNLNNVEVGDVLIPIPNDSFINKIHSLHTQTHDLTVQSKKFYEDAQNILLKELGLEKYTPNELSLSVRKLSECLKDDRFDAEYWQPEYDEILNKISKKKLKKIDDFAIVETGQYINEYVDEDINTHPFIRGTDISNLEIDTTDLLFVNTFKQKKKHTAQKNDVVVARVGSIGLCARIQDCLVGATISDNLIAIRNKKENNNESINSYYLTVYLNSFVGQCFMNRLSRGSVQQRLNQETLKELVVPVLDIELQELIEEKIKKAHSMREKAIELLEKAKHAVEVFVEKNETEALKIIDTQ